MELTGSYGNIRNFIHAVETGKEFVTIDRVALGEGFEDSQVLRLSLELSTYFRSPQP